MCRLVSVDAIELVPANIDDVRADIRGTGGRQKVRKFNTIQSMSQLNGFMVYVLLKGTVHAKIKTKYQTK